MHTEDTRIERVTGTPMFIAALLLSRVRLSAIPWTVAWQALLFMEFSRQEYWSGLPLLYPVDLLNTGIKPMSLTLQADSLLSKPPGKTHF